MRKTTTLLLAIILSACAGNIKQIDIAAQDKLAASLPIIEAGKGQLCLCRAYNFNGQFQGFDIEANYEIVAHLANASYSCLNLTPGAYNISNSKRSFAVSRDITVDAGQRKYLEFQVGFNGMHFNPMNPAQGLSCINSTM